AERALRLRAGEELDVVLAVGTVTVDGRDVLRARRVRVAVFLVGAEYRDTELFAGTRIERPDNDLLILLIGLDVALARVRSDVQLQDVTLHARRFRCRRIASRTEIEQMELQDREFESVGEEEQVYLDERLDERVEAAGHPEQAYGVAELA